MSFTLYWATKEPKTKIKKRKITKATLITPTIKASIKNGKLTLKLMEILKNLMSLKDSYHLLKTNLLLTLKPNLMSLILNLLPKINKIHLNKHTMHHPKKKLIKIIFIKALYRMETILYLAKKHLLCEKI